MKRNIYTALLIIFAFFCFSPVAAYANASEPPELIVIMKSAPTDVSVSIITDGSVYEGKRRSTAWETYYSFYKRDIGDNDEITLRISGAGISYNQIVGKQYLKGYNSIVTLDFSRQTIAEGKLPSRSILLVSLRVLLTLIIEGIIFFLFGFRRKKSWITFLVMNLITQGFLNILLNGSSPLNGYLIIYLIVLEILVFIAEAIVAFIFINEHSKVRRILFVLAANSASLVLGGYLITVLPV